MAASSATLWGSIRSHRTQIDREQGISYPFLAAGAILFLFTLAVFVTRYFAFDAVLDRIRGVLGAHALVLLEHHTALSRDLPLMVLLGAGLAAVLAVLAFPRARACVNAIVQWDAMHCWNLITPAAYRALLGASLTGLLVMLVWWAKTRFDSQLARYLFIKEGPFESLTFVFDFAASVLCAMAAHVFRAQGRTVQIARILFALLGVVLFLVAMEEINWGQTLFGFTTPEAWSRVNYQHETSIHNLVDKTELKATWHAVAFAFGVGTFTTTALSARFPHSLIGLIAPPIVMLPLALCAAFSGVALHPEVVEFLFSIFFLFYSYRIWRAARSSRSA